jgi:hypothetical protein
MMVSTLMRRSERHEIVGGQVREGGHARARIATLERTAQLLDRLHRDARIHHESRPLGRAAAVVAVTHGAARDERRRRRGRLRR